MRGFTGTHRTIRLLVLSYLIAVPVSVMAQSGWQVLVRDDAKVEQLTTQQVKQLFMYPEGSCKVYRLKAIDLAPESGRDYFYAQVLGYSAPRWRAHWSKIVFTGQGSPPEQVSVSQVKERLLQSTETIGYLPLSEPVPSRMKQVFVIQSP